MEEEGVITQTEIETEWGAGGVGWGVGVYLAFGASNHNQKTRLLSPD